MVFVLCLLCETSRYRMKEKALWNCQFRVDERQRETSGLHYIRNIIQEQEKITETAVSVNLKIILWLIAGFVLMLTFHGYHGNLDGYQQTLSCGRKVNISVHISVSLCQNLVINTFFCPEAYWPLPFTPPQDCFDHGTITQITIVVAARIRKLIHSLLEP